MQETGVRNQAYGADKFGLKGLKEIHWNLVDAPLYERAIAAGEANIVAGGALCAETGHHTGRSPKDKHTVVDDLTRNSVWWDGNRKMSQENFETLYQDFLKHCEGKQLFAQDLYGGADKNYRIKVRVFTELAWHSLFIRTLLIRPERAELASFVPDMTIIDLPSFRPDAEASRRPRRLRHHGGDRFHPQDRADLRLVLCRRDEEVGVHHAQFLSAGAGRDADALLGQCRPERRLGAVLRPVRHRQDHALGRSEPHADRRRRDRLGPGRHLQFRGRLLRQDASTSSHEAEPQIWDATNRFGAILENVVFDPNTRVPDYTDISKTENTRSAYPLDFIPNASRTGCAGHPKNIIFLTADAYGVMPPIAKLSPAQAMYHFLSGYTAKVAGTEKGLVGVQPEFSTCFGAPFLPRPPAEYGNLLRDYIAKHNVDCWLVNSGWTGGIYGVGRRMPIKATRALVTRRSTVR